MKGKKQGKSAKNKRVRLTVAMRSALRREQKRSGLSAEELVRECPEHLTGIIPAKINSWLDGQGEMAELAEYEHVLSLWRLLPEQDVFVKRSRTVLARLRSERARTQVGVRKLIEGRTDIPEGLTPKLAWGFLDGSEPSIQKNYLDYIHRCWEALPDWHVIEVTPELAATVEECIRRSGKGPATILRGVGDKPEGLNSDTIRKMRKVGATVRRDHLDYVLKLYETPDCRVAVPQGVRDQIRRHARRTGVGPNELLRTAGLVTADDPKDWSNWPGSRAREDELQTMLALWAALPDREGPRKAVTPVALGKRPRGHKKRLQSVELEERRRYIRFQEQVKSIIPLPEKRIAELFQHLLQNGGQFLQPLNAGEFAGLTIEEAAGIEKTYLRSF